MKKIFLTVIPVFLFTVISFSQKSDEQAIRQILDRQISEWNKGNIEEFAKGYWENDSLMFIGKTGVTYGYTNMIDNYKKGYSDTVQMGKLSFKILHVNRVSTDAYFVVGKWFLKRSVGDIGGHYTLLFRKIKGKWVIVADHSS